MSTAFRNTAHSLTISRTYKNVQCTLSPVLTPLCTLSIPHRVLLWIIHNMKENTPSWTTESKRENRKKYIKNRKAKFKEKGICPNCEKRSAASGRTCCQQCLEDKKLTAKFGTAGPYRQLYAELYERQKGLCGICHKQMIRPLLDHDHESMAVRGLLCSRCNVGLGQFEDDPKLLSDALYYLNNNAGIGITIKKR